MKSTLLRRIIYSILLAVIIFLIIVGSPRIIGTLFPEKLPIGYHYNGLAIMAVGLGIERLADLEPEVPSTITAFTDIEYKKVNGKSLQLDVYIPAGTEESLPL